MAWPKWSGKERCEPQGSSLRTAISGAAAKRSAMVPRASTTLNTRARWSLLDGQECSHNHDTGRPALPECARAPRRTREAVASSDLGTRHPPLGLPHRSEEPVQHLSPLHLRSAATRRDPEANWRRRAEQFGHLRIVTGPQLPSLVDATTSSRRVLVDGRHARQRAGCGQLVQSVARSGLWDLLKVPSLAPESKSNLRALTTRRRCGSAA